MWVTVITTSLNYGVRTYPNSSPGTRGAGLPGNGVKTHGFELVFCVFLTHSGLLDTDPEIYWPLNGSDPHVTWNHGLFGPESYHSGLKSDETVLKALDTFGNCERSVFALGVSTHALIKQSVNILANWSTKLNVNSERKAPFFRWLRKASVWSLVQI